jgi:hypothetical protein
MVVFRVCIGWCGKKTTPSVAKIQQLGMKIDLRFWFVTKVHSLAE